MQQTNQDLKLSKPETVLKLDELRITSVIGIFL